MLVIDRDDLSKAADAVAVCVRGATTTAGHKVVWNLDKQQIEKAICAALSMLTPTSGVDAVIPRDVQFCHDYGGESETLFPPRGRISHQRSPI